MEFSSESTQERQEHPARRKEPEEIFLDRIVEISGLDREKAARAASVVLCELERHLTGGEAGKLESELPDQFRDLLRECEREAGEKALRFDRSEFFQRVARQLDMPGRRVGPVVTGTLTAVREHISIEEARYVANQLPEDLKRLWEHPGWFSRAPELDGVEHRRLGDPTLPELAIKRHESRTTNSYLRFLEDLMDIGNLEADEAEAAAVSVLCALEQRISANEAQDLNSELPVKLRELLFRCDRHQEKPLRFDLDTLYDMVADDLQVNRESVVPVVHFVFCAVRQRISEGEAADVAAQLPRDIASVWLGAE